MRRTHQNIIGVIPRLGEFASSVTSGALHSKRRGLWQR
ncbi:uncharacterized protein METZ01_LOCUS354055, partial [marine metagenome]